eukprot:scaffold91465_cov37-Cyclotella_meneghiniana.AAC.2
MREGHGTQIPSRGNGPSRDSACNDQRRCIEIPEGGLCMRQRLPIAEDHTGSKPMSMPLTGS